MLLGSLYVPDNQAADAEADAAAAAAIAAARAADASESSLGRHDAGMFGCCFGSMQSVKVFDVFWMAQLLYTVCVVSNNCIFYPRNFVMVISYYTNLLYSFGSI